MQPKKIFSTKKSKCIFGAMLTVVILLNILSRNSPVFADWYVTNIFPFWVATYGRFMGLFPFSVGEWMIVAGVSLVILGILLVPLYLIVTINRSIFPENKKQTVRRGKVKRLMKGYYTFFAWVLLMVSLVMTLNCTLLYRATPFSKYYFKPTEDTYSQENLVALWNDIARNCNTLCMQVKRDEEGLVVYPGSELDSGKTGDMEDKAIENMKKLSVLFPRLSGYYPRPKAMFFSDFMCQQYMEGYYFPFSLEANYNDVMYVMNQPASLCHELAHLRGYIYEDEANFISFLACTQSDDPYFQYSGYLSVMNYVAREVAYAIKTDEDFWNKGYELEGILSRVQGDNVFVLEEEWERINKTAWFDTEAVEKASDAFVDTSLKINGVSDGKKSYSRVVQLLLQYYEQQKGL